MEVLEMKHQEFEQLLFEQASLSEDERARLQAHLRECEHCSRLNDQWVAVESVLRSTPSVPAPQGFTARFQERLERVRQRRQARIVLLTTILIGLGVLASVGLLGWALFSSGATIFSWVLKAFNQLYWVGTAFDVIVDTIIVFLESVLEQLPLVIWMAVSAAISVLSLTWITSFYRLSYREIRRE
jgi:hypothetical protein